MQCYLVLFVFLFACSVAIDGYHIQPIYVRPVTTRYAVGRDVTQEQQQQQQLHQQQQQKQQHHKQAQPQVEYVIETDAYNDADDEQQTQQQQHHHATTTGIINVATLPIATETYNESELTPLYIETDDYSFLPDRMPDLADDEYVAVADEEHQTPFTYLKHGEQVRLMKNEVNPLELNQLPSATAQPIYITMPIYINTPNADQQRPMFISMSSLPLASRPPAAPQQHTEAAAEAYEPSAGNEMEEHETHDAESAYEEDMEPAMEEPPSPTSHYNRLLRNYFHMARNFGAPLAAPFVPSLTGRSRAVGPAMGMDYASGRAIAYGRARARPSFMPMRPHFMPPYRGYYRHIMPLPYRPYRDFPMKR